VVGNYRSGPESSPNSAHISEDSSEIALLLVENYYLTAPFGFT
jgi:hypothetical protein